MSVKEVLRCRAGGIECVVSVDLELKVLNHISRLFGPDVSRYVSSLGRVIVCSGIFSEAYLVSSELLGVVKELFRSGYVPYSVGLYLGRLRFSRPYFIPSVNLLEVIYRRFGPRRALIVSESGIRPFLYGNDVLKASIISCYEPLSKGDVVGILGSDGYVYGVGLCMISSCSDVGRLKELEVVAKNIFDVGWYLRGGTEARERMFKV